MTFEMPYTAPPWPSLSPCHPPTNHEPGSAVTPLPAFLYNLPHLSGSINNVAFHFAWLGAFSKSTHMSRVFLWAFFLSTLFPRCIYVDLYGYNSFVSLLCEYTTIIWPIIAFLHISFP